MEEQKDITKEATPVAPSPEVKKPITHKPMPKPQPKKPVIKAGTRETEEADKETLALHFDKDIGRRIPDKVRAGGEKYIKQYKEDWKMVRGRFKFDALPGGELPLVYRKWDEPFYKKKMKDGEVYEVPLMVAKHLNENCFTTVHQNMQKGEHDFGSAANIGRKVYRCTFTPLDFVGMTSVGERSNLVTVEF